MIGKIASMFGGGAFKAMESIATEWIQTDKESAEAKCLMVKALDPNGKMRRQLSARVTWLYTVYILVTLVMIVCESFGLGPLNGKDLAVSVASSKITELFLPITALFGTIVTASFGVNAINTRAGG